MSMTGKLSLCCKQIYLMNASEDVTLKVTTYLSILTTSLEEWSEKQENRIND